MRHFRAGTGVVNALTFTPCGRTLHCVESKGLGLPHETVHWLDVERGELARTLDLREEAWRKVVPYAQDCLGTFDATVSPDGRWVAVRRRFIDPILLDLWCADSGAWREVEMNATHFVVDSACFSATSDLLVFASGTDCGPFTLDRLELASGRRLPIITYPPAAAWALCLSPDGQRIVALNDTGICTSTYHRDTPAEPWAIDEPWIADTGVPSATELPWTKLAVAVSDRALLRFHPRSSELALADGDCVFVWDCQSPDAVPVPDVGDGITDLAFAPDGELWALGYTDGTVRLRTREREVARFDWGIGRVASVAFAPDGLTCAAGGENGQIVLWDVDV